MCNVSQRWQAKRGKVFTQCCSRLRRLGWPNLNNNAKYHLFVIPVTGIDSHMASPTPPCGILLYMVYDAWCMVRGTRYTVPGIWSGAHHLEPPYGLYPWVNLSSYLSILEQSQVSISREIGLFSPASALFWEYFVRRLDHWNVTACDVTQ